MSHGAGGVGRNKTGKCPQRGGAEVCARELSGSSNGLSWGVVADLKSQAKLERREETFFVDGVACVELCCG